MAVNIWRLHTRKLQECTASVGGAIDDASSNRYTPAAPGRHSLTHGCFPTPSSLKKIGGAIQPPPPSPMSSPCLMYGAARRNKGAAKPAQTSSASGEEHSTEDLFISRATDRGSLKEEPRLMECITVAEISKPRKLLIHHDATSLAFSALTLGYKQH